MTYRSIGPGAFCKTFHMFCCNVYSTRHYNKQLLILSYLILSKIWVQTEKDKGTEYIIQQSNN